MTRDKQIEEMAKAINVADHEYCNGKCIGCEHKPMRIENCACIDIAIAKGLANAGYRKSTELAREIFEEIESKLILSKAIHCGQKFYYTRLEDDIAELKKKYTEGEG